MTGLIVLFLCALVLILTGIIALAAHRIEGLLAEREDDLDASHAKCMSLVAAFVGDRFAAQVLHAAATDYDTAEGQAQLYLMRDTVWAEGGPSMPSLWLRNRAEMILEKSDSRTTDTPGDQAAAAAATKGDGDG